MTDRPHQLTEAFEQLLDQHLDDLIHCRATEMNEITTFAKMLHVHPVHLSNIIKETTGTSPCGIYQKKITLLVRQLLSNPALSIREIGLLLDFEPSQFSKWFKRFHGISPKAYRKVYFS